MKPFPVIGGPLDGQMLTIEGWRDLTPELRDSYMAFNRGSYGRPSASKFSFTMVWLHQLLTCKPS